jgi:hypothetical protein
MEQRSKKILKHHNTTIDKDGVIIAETKITEHYVAGQPEYYQTFVFDLLKIKGLSGSSHLILLAILQKMNWDNEIALMNTTKQNISSSLKVSISLIDKAIKSYIDKEILLKSGRGFFIVNPYYFGKGTWKKISSIRMSIQYDKKGKAVIVNVDNDKQIEPNENFDNENENEIL